MTDKLCVIAHIDSKKLNHHANEWAKMYSTKENLKRALLDNMKEFVDIIIE